MQLPSRSNKQHCTVLGRLNFSSKQIKELVCDIFIAEFLVKSRRYYFINISSQVLFLRVKYIIHKYIVLQRFFPFFKSTKDVDGNCSLKEVNLRATTDEISTISSLNQISF